MNETSKNFKNVVDYKIFIGYNVEELWDDVCFFEVRVEWGEETDPWCWVDYDDEKDEMGG